MSGAPKYAKLLTAERGDTSLAAPQAKPRLLLRLTLGEMPLEDGLQLLIATGGPSRTLDDLLEGAFPGDPQRQSQAIQSLDVTENPDAPEMYAAVAELVGDWRRSRCALRFFVNHGSEIDVSDKLGEHSRPPSSGVDSALLDLVIEQRYTPLAYAVRAGHWASRRELLDWLQEHTLLVYASVKGQFSLERGPGAEASLARAARRMLEKGFLEMSPETEAITLARDGEQALARLIAEAELHVGRYAVFSDVLYDEEAEGARFGTGRGDDLTVAVCEAEGLDPVRGVYLILLYDLSLEQSLDDWWEAGGSEEFYDWLLEPAVDRDNADEAQLDRIIEAGLARVEEQQEAGLTRAAQQLALRRAR